MTAIRTITIDTDDPDPIVSIEETLRLFARTVQGCEFEWARGNLTAAQLRSQIDDAIAMYADEISQIKGL